MVLGSQRAVCGLIMLGSRWTVVCLVQASLRLLATIGALVGGDSRTAKAVSITGVTL
jgi:hypothetical protein